MSLKKIYDEKNKYFSFENFLKTHEKIVDGEYLYKIYDGINNISISNARVFIKKHIDYMLEDINKLYRSVNDLEMINVWIFYYSLLNLYPKDNHLMMLKLKLIINKINIFVNPFILNLKYSNKYRRLNFVFNTETNNSITPKFNKSGDDVFCTEEEFWQRFDSKTKILTDLSLNGCFIFGEFINNLLHKEIPNIGTNIIELYVPNNKFLKIINEIDAANTYYVVYGNTVKVYKHDNVLQLISIDNDIKYKSFICNNALFSYLKCAIVYKNDCRNLKISIEAIYSMNNMCTFANEKKIEKCDFTNLLLWGYHIVYSYIFYYTANLRTYKIIYERYKSITEVKEIKDKINIKNKSTYDVFSLLRTQHNINFTITTLPHIVKKNLYLSNINFNINIHNAAKFKNFNITHIKAKNYRRILPQYLLSDDIIVLNVAAAKINIKISKEFFKFLNNSIFAKLNRLSHVDINGISSRKTQIKNAQHIECVAQNGQPQFIENIKAGNIIQLHFNIIVEEDNNEKKNNELKCETLNYLCNGR